MKNLSTLNRYIGQYRGKLVLGIVFVFLSNLFRVFQPQLIRDALDQIVDYIKSPVAQRQPEVLVHQLMYFGLVVLVCALLMGLFMYFMRQTLIVMSRLIEYDQRRDIFAHYLKLDSTFYKKNKTGDIMSRISEDVNKVRMYLGPAFLYGFNLISLFIVVIFTMFKVNATLAFYTLLPLPLLSLIIYKVSNLINQRSEKIQKQLARITSVAQEAYSGIRIIKSFNTSGDWERYFGRETGRFRNLSMQLARVDSMFFPSMFLLVGISTLLTIYIGGLSVFEGSVTAGNIAEFVIYINMLTWPVSAIGWCASIIQQAEASQKRINEFLSLDPALPLATQPSSMPKDLTLDFHHVAFSYPESGITALQDLNLNIPPGSKVGIVGRTASGKSSLAELLLRMYDPQKGAVTIGGIDLRRLNPEELRRHIAYVPQDVFLFSDTVAGNILFGTSEADTNPATMREMARIAAVEEEIMSFQDQYDTIIGERGVTLSGGQKQRISIARALMRDAPIVILDDCLSAVDNITEEQIFNGLLPLLEGKTLLLITHRIAQTRFMDRILVMSDSRIIEEGTYDQLIEAGGFFKKLHDIETDSQRQAARLLA
ncbi:MAG: ABC transporter ATP-binding protein/permease [Saprospiraceae bacterium]|nr:ABC transporter ATP-binding protein/permease [Saprospiraceae bacterium]HMX86888.1 ABC transporter ATP-binding protein [Saprospiraceae bacterium]HMZ39004.1 ABC transporter ATP-binding protein [Saprospiraceae bacterium]HNA64818.1 ABC transporter ATP-binding protein [Saprospiraceae bacterium]HNC36431.1 ABC transporter ATP-binding protein [Saprospiraceae bacterium]